MHTARFPRTVVSLALGGFAALVCAGCVVAIGNKGLTPEDESLPWHAAHEASSSRQGFASATLQPRSGSSLSGNATFTETKDGVLVEVTVAGIEPGPHAVHVHETGDCSADDASSAGGHFNPEGHDHGAPTAVAAHAGDLGNVWVGEDGRGRLALVTRDLTVAPGPHSVVGRAIIVHAVADDMVSQPAGAAGARIGCGVIR